VTKSPIPSSILSLPQQRERWEKLLIEWSEQNSGSENVAGLNAMAEKLRAVFSQFGEVQQVAVGDRAIHAIRVAINPSAPRQLLFSGHYDTVYGPTAPFQQCRKVSATRLGGPGVADMKGGLVVLAAALEAFRNSPHAHKLGGVVLLTPDEETGSAASREVICLAARGKDAALVFEPARENGNLVRRRMAIGAIQVRAFGQAAHAGKARTEGKNAIVALSLWIARIQELAAEQQDVVINVGRISGGGAINIVPAEAEADINVRAWKQSSADALLQRLHSLAADISHSTGVRLDVSGGFERPPKEVTPRDEALFAAWSRCSAELGHQTDWQDAAGGSDGNLIAAQGVPTLDGLGPVGGHLHSVDEYIELDSLIERAQRTALFLHRLAGGEIQLLP
jgi:glutamate carboxypeptidase